MVFPMLAGLPQRRPVHSTHAGLVAARRSARPPRVRALPLRPRSLGWRPSRPVLAIGLLVGLALWLAPEAPQTQAAICQRYNGPVACRVW